METLREAQELIYTLTATLGGKVLKSAFAADDDNAAIFEGSFRVLDLASDNETWAKGRIELRDYKGNLLKEMAAK